MNTRLSYNTIISFFSRYQKYLTRVPLRIKLLVPILIVILGSGTLLALMMRQKLEEVLWEELSRRVEATLAGVSIRATQEILVEDFLSLKETVRQTASLPDIEYVFIQDYHNEVLADSFQQGVPEPLLDFAQIPAGKDQNMVSFHTEHGLINDYAIRMLGGGLGTVHIGVTHARIREQADKVSKQIFLVTAAVATISIGLIYLIAYILTEPIRVLTKSLQKVGEGDFSIRSDIVTGDEIGDLASQFNAMTEKLAQWEEKLKDAQKLLLRSERLATIGKIASGVAHEIGNPLHAAQQLSKALAEQPDRVHHYLPLIYEGLLRIHQVVSELNSYARERPIYSRPVDIHTIIKDSIRLLEYRARQKDVKLVMDLKPGLPKIHGDPNALGQVIINMVVNGLEAIQEEMGTINIRTFISLRHNGHPDQVGISISDNGIGIPVEEIERIFDPFYTTKEPGQGTGLGLAICQDIVGLHGGHIEVKSKKGKGTTFTVWLPAREGDSLEEDPGSR